MTEASKAQNHHQDLKKSKMIEMKMANADLKADIQRLKKRRQVKNFIFDLPKSELLPTVLSYQLLRPRGHGISLGSELDSDDLEQPLPH